MSDSVKMRLICGVTAAAANLIIAYPYNGHSYLLAVPAGYNPLAGAKDKLLKTTLIQ